MRTVPLRTFVGRVLLLRVAAAGAVLCAAAAALAWFTERGRMEDRVEDSARAGLASLVNRTRDLLAAEGGDPAEALRRVLARAAETPVVFDSGRFVRVEFRDRAGAVLAEARVGGHPGIGGVEAFLAAAPPAFPAAGEVTARTVDAGEGWHVLVDAPFEGRGGEVLAAARAVFAVSEESAARARATALRAALLAAAVVLAVTAVLYPVVLALAGRLADYSTALLAANLETLAVLGSAIAQRDRATDAHTYRVTLYSVRLGEAAGLDGASLRALLKGAFLHDVGKIGIPDAVLLKPGKLDEKEFEVMKTHVPLGVEIVSRSAWLAESIRVVGSHHEKYLGRGYPAGVEASSIPVEARVFAIADVFDALTSERPYKEAFGFDRAMGILEEGRGAHFDPALLDLFRGIAPDLHRRYAGKERADLEGELRQVLEARFSEGPETLRW
ncbi:MAG: HD-GYP domain-containing protein [Planctomycetes bacterium]|nr:HD-GYP domain-containing protein [Planctomycetota bacterium]